MRSTKETMLSELVEGILSFMSDQVVRIILYGSFARGTETQGSDIDIALITRGPLDARAELELSALTVDMNLKYDEVFSIIDIDEAFFLKWKTAMPFYRNVEREGVVLWKAA